MTRIWMLLCIVLLGAGCSANFPQSPTPTPTLAAIQIHYSTPHDAINPRNTASLFLYAIDSEGIYTSVTNRAQWVSTNTAVVSTVNGTATGVADGSADVIASYQGLTAVARIVVGTRPSLRISLPGSPEVGMFQVTAQTGFGTDTRNVTDQVTWASSHPEILTVDRGRVTAHGPGTAAIIVTLGNATTTTYVSIMPIRSLP